MKIPYLSLQKLNGLYEKEIEEAALRVVRSGYYLYGSEVRDFERRWASYCGTSYCVGTANGLDALTAILVGMKTLYGWGTGSEVIVSAHTFVASFLAITRAGLTPVPCDATAHDYLMNTSLLENLIGPHTVAIMPVHLYGRVCDMKTINAIASKYGLQVVSDACQAHGICKNENLGDATAFSFYPGKNLGALGDGGCLVTDNEQLASFARTFCNYGSRTKYNHEVLGINSRLDSIQAAILNAKLDFLDRQNEQRQMIARFYNDNISNPHVTLPYDDEKSSNWHIYPIFTGRRDAMQEYLATAGIQTLIHYPIPPHKQKAYSSLNTIQMPVCERLCETVLSIPLNPTLTTSQQKYIVDTINAYEPSND